MLLLVVLFYFWIVFMVLEFVVCVILYVGWIVFFIFFFYVIFICYYICEKYGIYGNIVEDFFVVMVLYLFVVF